MNAAMTFFAWMFRALLVCALVIFLLVVLGRKAYADVPTRPATLSEQYRATVYPHHPLVIYYGVKPAKEYKPLPANLEEEMLKLVISENKKRDAAIEEAIKRATAETKK